jgi:DNA polymerase-3 subunit epsilon
MDYKCYYFVADLETGGLFAKKNPIVEIAIVVLDQDMNIVEKYSTIINSTKNVNYGKDFIIGEQALKANGLTIADILQGESPSIVFKEVCELFKKYTLGRNKPILVGHNWRNFDSQFLEEFFNFFKQDLYQYTEKFCYDTMWMARSKWPRDISNYKLGSCCEKANVELIDAHEALADTLATTELFKFFIQSLRSEGNNEVTTKKFRHTFQF